MSWATDDEYVALEVTWLFYQDLTQAYGHPKQSDSKKLMDRITNTLRKGLPLGLEELVQFGKTLWHRREGTLSYFYNGASNGQVEAIHGRLEHLYGIALGLRNPNHYILRCLIRSRPLNTRIDAV